MASPSHAKGVTSFQMLSEEELKAAGASGATGATGKPSLLSRLWNRPITRLAMISAALVAIILVIALPAALASGGGGGGDSNSDDSSSDDSSSDSSGSGSDKPSPTSTSGSTPTATIMSPGCGISHSTGWSNATDSHSIMVGSDNRTYAINVPSHYNDKNDSPWPLIVDYHGAGNDPLNEYNNSRYWAYDRGEEYIVVYPQGRAGLWLGAEYSWDVDDFQFSADLLSHINETYCIDQDRIYASGKSNGAGFVDMLACSDEGDPFAAFALASAALYGDTDLHPTDFKDMKECRKSRAVLEVHGGEDEVVPYNGQKNGEGGPSPSIPEWNNWWARRDGCKKNVEGTSTNNTDAGYNTTTYSCDGYDDILKFMYVPEMNHCWPSPDGNNSDASARPTGCAYRGLDFTETVLDWFEKWNKTNVPTN